MWGAETVQHDFSFFCKRGPELITENVNIFQGYRAKKAFISMFKSVQK